MIDQFPAGFPAGIETRILVGSLAVQREQAESLPEVFGGFLAFCDDALLQGALPKGEQFLVFSGNSRLSNQLIEHLADVSEFHQLRPFFFTKSNESETFSCRPTFFGFRPSAMPSNCVK